MTMFYVRAMWKEADYHNNVPAESARGAFDFVRANVLPHAGAVIAEIRPLFDFESEEPSDGKLVEVN